MIENLLNLHKKTLDVKNIKTKQDLIKIIRLDFEKIIYALSELENKETPQLLKEFFSEHKEVVPDILAQLERSHLYHIGFEVNEPLELVLFGFKNSIKKFSQGLDGELKILRVLLFPASQAFQKRVNAYADIMRIWMQIRNHELMLELFDIHHPVDRVIPKNKYQVDVKDNIWHYAVYVDSAEKVRQLHNYFKNLVETHTIYHLPFKSIIDNKNDGSFLTKIINKQTKIEIEFVNGPFVTGPIPSPPP